MQKTICGIQLNEDGIKNSGKHSCSQRVERGQIEGVGSFTRIDPLVHVIHEWAWAGTPNEGAVWLRLQRLADTWHQILLIPVLGRVIVGMLHGLLDILGQIQQSTSSQGHEFDVLAGIFPTVNDTDMTDHNNRDHGDSDIQVKDPFGSIARVRAKKFKESLQALIQAVQSKYGVHKLIEGQNPEEHTMVSLIQVVKGEETSDGAIG